MEKPNTLEIGPMGSNVAGTASTILKYISPIFAITGIGIPIAFALYTCSVGLKLSEDNNDLAANIKECKEFLLQWLIMCNNNLVVYDKYKNLAIPYYEEKIDEEKKKISEESEKKIKIYQWKIDYIKKKLNEMLEAGETFTEVMLGLSYYIEECVNYNISQNGKFIKAWVIESKVKSGVIQHLIGSLNARFVFFNEVTTSTKDLCHFCITLNDVDALGMMIKAQKPQTSGGDVRDFFQKAKKKAMDFKEKATEQVGDAKTIIKEKATEQVGDAKTIIKEKAMDFKEKAMDFKEKATEQVGDAKTIIKEKATTFMDIFIQGFKEFINKLNIKYQDLRSKWQKYREKDVLFQSLKSVIIETKEDLKENIKNAREKFMNTDNQLSLDDCITRSILYAQLKKSYDDLNENIDDAETKFKNRKEDFTNIWKGIIDEEQKMDTSMELKLDPSMELKLYPSQDMIDEIDKIKTQKKGIFKKIYDSLFSGNSAGGLSTRRKRKRRPKFHQVRSYKQRPKQHRLK